jgi:hypothetical protein
MAILTKSILVLEDGKISAFDFHNKETYIQPEIIVNTLDAIEQMTIFGQFRETVNIDITIQSIDGVAFAGNFAALETALRLAAKKANGLAVGGVGGGGGGGGDASAANQLLEITELQSIATNTVTNSTAANQVLEIAELQSIATNTLTSSTQSKQDTQITELQKLTSSNSPSQQQLTNPAAVVVSNFKKLDFVCTGAITVTIDGNSIIYPFSLGGGGRAYGSSFEADSLSLNPATFNGTGTVLITTKQ